jgi:hypothetical protein
MHRFPQQNSNLVKITLHLFALGPWYVVYYYIDLVTGFVR